MATTPKVLGRGTLTTSNATLYTTPSATTAIVTSIALCNTNAAARTVDLSLGGVLLVDDLTIAPKTTVVIDLRQVLVATNLIQGLASAATSVTYHISGVEIA
jgi:hypothetical protein